MQISQSSLGGGCLKRALSRSSEARCLHAFLCFGQCALWQEASQYFTSLQPLHALRPSPPFPQVAHISSALLIVKCLVLIQLSDERKYKMTQLISNVHSRRQAENREEMLNFYPVEEVRHQRSQAKDASCVSANTIQLRIILKRFATRVMVP